MGTGKRTLTGLEQTIWKPRSESLEHSFQLFQLHVPKKSALVGALPNLDMSHVHFFRPDLFGGREPSMERQVLEADHGPELKETEAPQRPDNLPPSVSRGRNSCQHFHPSLSPGQDQWGMQRQQPCTH